MNLNLKSASLYVLPRAKASALFHDKFAIHKDMADLLRVLPRTLESRAITYIYRVNDDQVRPEPLLYATASFHSGFCRGHCGNLLNGFFPG